MAKFNIIAYSRYKPMWYRGAKTARHGRAHLAYDDELRPHLLKYANRHVASISNYSYPKESKDLTKDWRVVILAKPHIIFTVRFKHSDIERAKEWTIKIFDTIMDANADNKDSKYASRIVAHHKERESMTQGKKSVGIKK